MPTKSEKRERRYIQFSKIVTGCFAAVMFPMSAYTIRKCLYLAELAILNNFTGSLPYITAIVGFVQAAVTVVLGFYFKNSEKEKVARITAGASAQGANTNRDC